MNTHETGESGTQAQAESAPHTTKIRRAKTVIVQSAGYFARKALKPMLFLTLILAVLGGFAAAFSTKKVTTSVPYSTDTGMFRRWSIAKDDGKVIQGTSATFGSDQLQDVQMITSDGKVYANPATSKSGGPNKWISVPQ